MVIFTNISESEYWTKCVAFLFEMLIIFIVRERERERERERT
jgi:hypothetical protein